jgi:hypothetical protein
MKRRTTTKQLSSAITNNLLKVQKAEIYHKTTSKTEPIANDTLIENLQFLSESGVFSNCISWRFEKAYKTNGYIAECGRTEGNAENIITVYLCTGDGVIEEDLEKVLVVEETEE